MPVLEDEAFAPTRTPASRQSSAATAPGRQSMVTGAPAEEMRVLAAELGAGRRRLMLALLGVGVVAGVAGIAFVAGRSEPRSEVPLATPAPAAPVAAMPVPPPPAPPVPRAAEPVSSPPASPGFLVVKVQPWGKLFVDGKPMGDVEGVSRRIALGPGTHTARLINGKKARSWTVEIEPGKTEVRQHSFIEE